MLHMLEASVKPVLFDPARSSRGLPVQFHLFDTLRFLVRVKRYDGDLWREATAPVSRGEAEVLFAQLVAQGFEVHIAPAPGLPSERLQWPHPVALGYDQLIPQVATCDEEAD